MTPEQIEQWLKESPPEEEISYNEDGSSFLDIVVVENHLHTLDNHWGTENFKSRVFQIQDKWFGSASVELVVNYNGDSRRLVGAATIRVFADYLNEVDITHIEPTLLSETIKNASKKLGARFGKYLNDRGVQNNPTPKGKGKNKPSAVRMKPDASIMKKYQHAIIAGDQVTIDKLILAYDIKTE